MRRLPRRCWARGGDRRDALTPSPWRKLSTISDRKSRQALPAVRASARIATSQYPTETQPAPVTTCHGVSRRVGDATTTPRPSPREFLRRTVFPRRIPRRIVAPIMQRSSGAYGDKSTPLAQRASAMARSEEQQRLPTGPHGTAVACPRSPAAVRLADLMMIELIRSPCRRQPGLVAERDFPQRSATGTLPTMCRPFSRPMA